MTTPQTPVYRSHTTPPTNKVEYRQPQDDEDGVFEVRMPIATTGQVRNEGDDPLTRDELSGMATQIENRSVGVFLDHGGTSLGGMERYSAVEKVGEWRDAEVESTQDEDGPSELVATARLMDPETLPNGVSELREAVGSIKEQVKRDFSVSASIGWREDDAYPGGNDLMEASIVGIGADPRTTSSSADASVVARAAVEAGADPEELVATVRDAVEGERPLGPPGDEDRFESFEECVQALAEDGDLTEEEAERVCGAWENAKDQANDSVTDDSDTGSGEAGTTNDGEQNASSEDGETSEREQAPEWVSDFRDLLESIHAAVREDDEDDDDEEDEEENEADDDEDEDDEDDEEEQSADSDMEERIAELEDTLEAVRSGEEDVESPSGGEPSEEQDADTESGETNSEDSWRQLAN